MPYSDRLKTVFLHVPKTGGTAVKRLLGIRRLNSPDPDVIPSPQHLTCSLLRDRIGAEKYDDYFKFAFVRNPWSRMASEYFWRQKGSRRRTNLDFAAFIRHAEQVVRSGEYYGRSFDDHFIPQVEFTRDVDRVCRFEQFARDLHAVAGVLGIDELAVPPKHARPWDDFRSFYDDGSRKRVASMYAEDIEIFGYAFED